MCEHEYAHRFKCGRANLCKICIYSYCGGGRTGLYQSRQHSVEHVGNHWFRTQSENEFPHWNHLEFFRERRVSWAVKFISLTLPKIGISFKEILQTKISNRHFDKTEAHFYLCLCAHHLWHTSSSYHMSLYHLGFACTVPHWELVFLQWSWFVSRPPFVFRSLCSITAQYAWNQNKHYTDRLTKPWLGTLLPFKAPYGVHAVCFSV